MGNLHATIPENISPLDEAVATFDLVGFMLARLETLACAVRDERLDRACLKVLAALIQTMNRETRTSWAGRAYIAQQCGVTPKSAGNYIYQLKALGYIVSEKRETPQANNRVLMHYTLAKLSPNEIEAAINLAIGSIRGGVSTVVSFESARGDGQKSARGDGQSEKVPVGTGKYVPVLTGTACQDGHNLAQSARQDGCSNSNINNKRLPRVEKGVGTEGAEDKAPEKPKSKDRGTRLNRNDNDLARRCVEWAITNYEITRQQAHFEWQFFSDYWTGKPDGLKLDWLATWRNWVRNSRKNYKPRTSALPEELKRPSEPVTRPMEGVEFKGGDM